MVLVSAAAGMGALQVTLNQSSGYSLLDQAALELVRRASIAAAVPEALRNRPFGVALPIQYRLDD